MDTDDRIEKSAGVVMNALKNAPKLYYGSKELLTSYLLLMSGLGLAGGGIAGMAASAIKKENPEYKALKAKKMFYDSKIEENRNMNWLNDLMAAKRRLETGRLTDAERSDLEKKDLRMVASR